MNKKLKSLRNRLVQTIQDNYNVKSIQDKNKSFSNKQRFKTLLNQKIQTLSPNKNNANKKRVYMNTTNGPNLYQNLTFVYSEKEETLINQNLQTDQRYIKRVKSSNNGNISNFSISRDPNLRKTTKVQKILKNISDIQFQSQLYWNGNSSYLVTGVKNQYQKIKKNYEDKCKEIQKIKKQCKVDTVKQLRLYIQKLQTQNLKLIEACTKYSRKVNKSNQKKYNLHYLILENYPSKDPEDIQKEFELKMEKLHKKIENLKHKNTNLAQQNQKLAAKIFIQQKIIIQKDNLKHKIELRSKKVQKQLNEMKESLSRSQQKFKQDVQKAQEKVNELKMSLKEQFCLEKRILIDKISEKDNKIQKIEKQLNHLKSLLQHWKHGDFDQLSSQADEIFANRNESDSRGLQNIQVSKIFIESNFKSDGVEKERIKPSNKIKLNFKNSIQQDIPLKKDSNCASIPSQRSLNRSAMKSKANESKNTGRSTQKTIKRQRVTASTHKSDSIRCRPVQLTQVQHVIEYLKLKLAFNRINPNKVKEFFQFRKSSIQINDSPVKNDQNHSEKKQETFEKQKNQETSWEQEYITLKEVYDVFLKEPFTIRDAEALLLSRFVIEDVKEPYVYMNWDSQNSRRMVESIIFNLLSFNEITEDTIEKSKDLLKKYETVVIPAIKSVSGRTGKVSRDKFIEILNGLGLERTKCMDDYMIGKMCSFSQSLNELIFQSLHENQKENSKIQLND